MVKYHSTRGGVHSVSFVDAVMMGLATDGGLLVPEEFPTISDDQVKAWEGLSFQVPSQFMNNEIH